MQMANLCMSAGSKGGWGLFSRSAMVVDAGIFIYLGGLGRCQIFGRPDQRPFMTYLFCLMAMLTGSPVFAQAGEKIDQTEVSIAEFSQFVAATGYITKAEQNGGMVYESGWVTKPNWNWRQPYGVPSDPQEPAVHITFDEAEIFVNGEESACPHGKNGSAMAIPKCAMIQRCLLFLVGPIPFQLVTVPMGPIVCTPVVRPRVTQLVKEIFQII